MERVKLIPFCLFLVVALSTTNAFSQDGSFQETFFVNDDVSIWNECAGEDLSGTLPYQINIYYDENGDFNGGVIIPLPGVLIGEVTGDVYHSEGGEVTYSESILHGQRTQTESHVRAEIARQYENSKQSKIATHRRAKYMRKNGGIKIDFQLLSTECY